VLSRLHWLREQLFVPLAWLAVSYFSKWLMGSKHFCPQTPPSRFSNIGAELENTTGILQVNVVNSTYFGLLAEFGEANIPLARVAPKYFGLSFPEARRRAPAKLLPCRTFRLGGQKSPWLVSATDLAELIDVRRAKAG
jgi:hypothetical protein